MKLTTKVIFLLLLVGAIVLVAEAGCYWQPIPTCTLPNPTGDDTLGRRTSGLLAPPQDQGVCGSCWAFAAAHTFTDRRSIGVGSRTSLLSSQYPTTDTTEAVNGCCGADIFAGFRVFQASGEVTDSCSPYTLGETSCSSSTLSCPTTCNDRTPFQPGNLRIRGYRQLTSDTQVISALRRGSVILEMKVPQSFFRYRCGVFCSDPTNLPDRLHAVEIVDYGTSAGTDFWVVKNSWGSGWGEGGYFRIRRGDPALSRYGIPLLSSSQTVSSPNTNTIPCAPVPVSNPSQDMLAMSAVNFTVMYHNGSIPCRDNSPATSISLTSIASATTQVVAGLIITHNSLVTIQGCMQPTWASINSVVFMHLNGTFEIMSSSYQHLVEGGAGATSGNILLLLLLAATIMAVLTIGCY